MTAYLLHHSQLPEQYSLIASGTHFLDERDFDCAILVQLFPVGLVGFLQHLRLSPAQDSDSARLRV